MFENQSIYWKRLIVKVLRMFISFKTLSSGTCPQYTESLIQLEHYEIGKKTAYLLIGLLTCLKCFFSIEESKQIELFGFFSRENIKHYDLHIFIDGLKFTCLKFFRTLIRMVNEHKHYFYQQEKMRI